jgi:hypothetical protein
MTVDVVLRNRGRNVSRTGPTPKQVDDDSDDNDEDDTWGTTILISTTIIFRISDRGKFRDPGGANVFFCNRHQRHSPDVGADRRDVR